jgi:hypothetical protein
MFSSPAASPTNRSPLRRPSHSNRCHPERSEGSCLVPLAPIAPFEQSLLCRRPFLLAVGCELSTVNCHPVSPFPATLTANSQLTENSATLSPVSATLTGRVNPNPFVCHSYKKPGVEYIFQVRIFSFRGLTTNYSPLSTISFIIRTSKTQHLKPFRMNTYKKTGRGAPVAHTSNCALSLPHYLVTSLHRSFTGQTFD